VRLVDALMMLGSEVLPAPRNLSRNDLTREYVAGGVLAWFGASRLVLPWAFDEITGEFGLEVYEKMLLDSQVSACITLWKASILEEGVELSCALEDPLDPDYDKAKEIVDAARIMLDQLDPSFEDSLWNMLDAIVFGHKVGELVYEIRKDRLDLAHLKVKPSRSIAFVVDDKINVLGILGDLYGIGTITLDSQQAVFLPREKFAILTFRPKDSDPRGTSLLRPAYDPWWRKTQLKPEYMKYMAQFASPSVIGYTPEDSTLEDADTADTTIGQDPDAADPTKLTPEEAMVVTLIKWRNGVAAAFPGGAKVDLVQSTGDGAAFLNAIGECNLEITKGILTQQLATEEGQFMARAAATVHQDVLDTLIRQGKRHLVKMIKHDILERWIAYNWGPDAAVRLVPNVTLGTVEHQDRSPLYNAIANLVRSGFFTEAQLVEVDKLLSLPVRVPGDPRIAAPGGQPAQKPGQPGQAPVQGDQGMQTQDGTQQTDGQSMDGGGEQPMQNNQPVPIRPGVGGGAA
jgi:hypothetical protein